MVRLDSILPAISNMLGIPLRSKRTQNILFSLLLCASEISDCALEAGAKRRLADEYDAAQDRGEVASGRDGPGSGVVDGNAKPTTADLGLRRDQIHEARQMRDAEIENPGVTQRTLDKMISEEWELPTKVGCVGRSRPMKLRS